MKKKVFATTVVCCGLLIIGLLNACKKGADLFCGNYSYKTSGYISYTLTTNSSLLDNSVTRTFEEIGSIDIKHLKKSDSDSILIVENTLGGGLTVFYAATSNDSLQIKPYDKEISLSGNLSAYQAHIHVTGYGIITDGLILITEQYSGFVINGDKIVGTISADNIQTVAKQNR